MAFTLPSQKTIEEENNLTREWINYFVDTIDRVEDCDTKEILQEALKMYLDLTFRPRMLHEEIK